MDGFKSSDGLLSSTPVSKLVAVAQNLVKEVWLKQRRNDSPSFVYPNADPTGIENTDVIMSSKRCPPAVLTA